jgi:NADPH2:quinone reductase
MYRPCSPRSKAVVRDDVSEQQPGSQIYNIQKGPAAREAGLASQSTTHDLKGKPMSGIRAVVVDPEAPNRLALADVGEPSPTPSEALVRVAAVSLNRGEVRRAESSEPGFRPGWDLAGTVERAAADGSGPQEGSRVVGFLPSGAWAELVAVPTDSVAALPEDVSFEEASTLPVAGLTALYALEEGAYVLGRSVLVTGASGGAGQFGLQLARAAGARVVGLVRREEHAGFVEEAGAHEVVVDESGAAAREQGPYHLVLESVGGEVLGNALSMLAPGGTCVSFGTSASTEVEFDARTLYLTGGARLYGFILFHEVLARPASGGLDRLARMVADGRLKPRVEVVAPWTEVGEVARRLIERGYTGKAVLQVGPDYRDPP